MKTTSKLFAGIIVSTALFSAPYVHAGTSALSPEMKTAFAKADQGPDQLRWYVQRTKTIYGLDYADVLERRAQSTVALKDGGVVVAEAKTK